MGPLFLHSEPRPRAQLGPKGSQPCSGPMGQPLTATSTDRYCRGGCQRPGRDKGSRRGLIGLHGVGGPTRTHTLASSYGHLYPSPSSSRCSVTSAPGLGQATIVSLQDLRNSLLTSLLSSVAPPLAFPQGQISQRYPTGSRGQAWSPPLAAGSSTIRPCPLLQPPLLLTPEPLTLTPVGQNSWFVQYMNQISPCASHVLGAGVRLQ